MPDPKPAGPNSALPSDAPFSFEDLVACEEEQLRLAGSQGGRREFDREVSSPGAADEPWLAYTNRDRVGLSLSGGGIRSATFNLGVLQALQAKGVLGLMDYVATVSGGGYAGGFWTAWRLNSRESAKAADGAGSKEPLLFPKPTEENLTSQPATDSAAPRLPPLRDNRERPEIRHLREFSRFLMPRLGVFEVEMWNGVVAVLGGLIPSLTFVGAFTGMIWLGWMLTNCALVDTRWFYAGGMMAVITLLLHTQAEKAWHAVHPAEPEELNDHSVGVLSVFAAAISGAAVVLVRWVWNRHGGPVGIEPMEWRLGEFRSAGSAVYIVALAWAGTGGALLLARFVHFGLGGDDRLGKLFSSRALDRTIARCLAPAVVWAGLGLIWQTAVELSAARGGPGDGSGGGGAVTGGAAVALGAAFAYLRRWLETSVKSAGKSGWLDRLKPLLPQWIANAAVLLFFLFVAQQLVRIEVWKLPVLIGAVAVCGGLMGFILWMLDPSRIGLHDFYRSRIARCFLGAANPAALRPVGGTDYNRYTHERRKDDFDLKDLHSATLRAEADPSPTSPLPLRPIHLVCCAANNIDGDHLASLYRGARSAVISQRGLSLGDQTRLLPDLKFSAALTASASAFNSQMGGVSMALGPAVTFLMVALNLRLGLWLPHPCGREPLHPWLPGRLFFRELMGWTQSATPTHDQARKPDYVHLSDGAHFENFGFYELIRRHCRYIVLCDCGADPENTYDDFATSLRRIREDFGVEVEIDFGPIRPGPDGLSTQHMAVGTIHYDGLAGSDKGTLLYFKPTLTGDEPCDVAQYRRMNPEFPQQTTADQFYDEAQWESYRRLGEHSALVVFRFIDQIDEGLRKAAEPVFYRAARQWKPGSRDSGADLTALADRASALESSIRDEAPPFLRAEFFPEAGGSAAVPSDRDEELRALFFLMQAAQVMEDAWGLCRLGTEAQHPINEGWMAYISRWAVMPSFRRWWPLISAMYSEGFRQFLNRRFQLSITRDPALTSGSAAPRVTLPQVSSLDPAGLAVQEWRRRRKQFSHEDSESGIPTIPSGTQRVYFELRFEMEGSGGGAGRESLQVGFAMVEIFKEGTVTIVRLANRDFFVPEAFAGCGFIEAMLDHLIDHFVNRNGVNEIRIWLDPTQGQRDPNSRQRRVHLIGFFKSRYFVYRRRPGGTEGGDIEEMSRDVALQDAVQPQAAAPVRVA